MLVVGLGNPGARYERTRHNAGFRVVEAVVNLRGARWRRRWFAPTREARIDVGRGRLYLAEPLTYVNRSGESIPGLLRRAGLGWESLLVVCDSMDIPVGRLRLRIGGGTAGHGGLKSILATAGTEAVPRLYVGVGRPSPGTSVVDHVLGIPEPEEEAVLSAAEAMAGLGIISLPEVGFEAAMNELNKRV